MTAKKTSNKVYEVLEDFSPSRPVRRGRESILIPVAEAAMVNPGKWVKLNQLMSDQYKASAREYLKRNYEGLTFSVHTEQSSTPKKVTVYIRCDNLTNYNVGDVI